VNTRKECRNKSLTRSPKIVVYMVKLIARTGIDRETDSINRDIGRKAAAISRISAVDIAWSLLHNVYGGGTVVRYGLRDGRRRLRSSRLSCLLRKRERGTRSTAPRCAISRYARCDRVALTDFNLPSVCRRWVASNQTRLSHPHASTHARTHARS